MTKKLSAAESALRDAAREYHALPSPGKITVRPTKPLSNQRDLSLAYSPGVAYPCLDIQADPAKAAEYTSRGNLVGVITNGTAVLGLGDIGPLAGKPGSRRVVRDGSGRIPRGGVPPPPTPSSAMPPRCWSATSSTPARSR